jgi:ATP-dependent Zn protease
MKISDPDDPMHDAKYLRAMAFHEAGHAVVAWSLNLPVGDIYIREIDAGNGGALIDLGDHLPFIDKIAVCLAGIEAANVFQSPQHPWAGRADHCMVFDLLKGTPDDQHEGLWNRGEARANELLVEHKSKVIRLAERLVEVRQVDAAEFMRLMNA